MKNKFFSTVFLVAVFMSTQAQFGGQIKRVKDKISEKKVAETNINSKSMINDEYAVSENGKSMYNDEVKISFSSAPFKASNSQISNNFTTGNRIYAKLTTQKGSLKEALKIGDNDDGIKIYLVLYNTEGEKLKKFSSIAETFEINTVQAGRNFLTLDILPDPANFDNGKQSDLYVGAAFAYGHNQFTFTQNGDYRVGLFVKNEKVDDWGKPIYGEDIIFADFFNYNFAAKDAGTIVKESKTINEAKNNSVKNAITPLPKQWVEKTFTPVMGFTQAQLTMMYENSFDTKLDAHSVVKLHASSSNGGWTVQSNDYGIPIYRYSNQWYTIFIKYSNGGSCYFQGFGLRQQYNGSGIYGKAFIDKNEYHMADCGSMK